MTTARQTIGTIFGAVSSAASVIGTTCDSMTTAVDMGHEAITNAARHQKLRNAARESSFEMAMTMELAMEDTQREAEIIEFCKTPELEKIFTKHERRIAAALAKAKGITIEEQLQISDPA